MGFLSSIVSAKFIKPNTLLAVVGLCVINLCVLNLSQGAANKPLKTKKLEKQIQQALSAFHTPGMSVAIVHKGKVVLSQGYGMANIENGQAVNSATYFRIASLSKAFTASALAILVDEGKLSWDDKVIDYLPNFRMQNPYVTREFTITDLLTHRSGLVGGAGDSMIWPEPSGFSRQEVVQNLRYLSPEYSFRARYAYSNVMYITAGEVVAAVSQMPFDTFVETRIFAPLNMQCFAGDIPSSLVKNAANAYGHNDERGIYSIPRNAISEQGLMAAAAGGIVCNAEGMNKWMLALLDKQSLPFSEDQLNKMWQAHTILNVSETDEAFNGTLFNNYGLGWRLANIGGLKVVSHTGTLSGYQAYVVLIPDLELGITLLNNGSHSGARNSVMQSILKVYLEQAGYTDQLPLVNDVAQKKVDWVQSYLDYYDEREQAYLAKNIQAPVATAPMSISNQSIIGEYKDSWFGSLIIHEDEQQSHEQAAPALRIYSTKMPTLVGTITAFEDTRYKIEWDNKNAASDAFMLFKLNINRDIVSATLHPFKTEDSNSHEYRDMEFMRVPVE